MFYIIAQNFILSFDRFKIRTSTISSSEVQSPEADTSAPPPPPITIYLYKTCSGGPLVDTSQLPASVEDTSPTAVTKRLVMELLAASSKSETVLARLGSLRGEEMVISHGGTTYTIKLPQLLKTSDLDRVFGALATALGCCHQLFSKYERSLSLITLKPVLTITCLKWPPDLMGS